jgi:hypothetical protein
MLKIGESLDYTGDSATFADAYQGTSFKLNDPTFISKTLLISFIEIDNGWTWLHNLINLHDSFSAASDVFIVAIIYRNTAGGLTDVTIQNKISTDPVLSGIDFYTISNFYIAPDKNDSGTSLINKYAVIYSNSIIYDTPDFYTGYGAGIMISYLARNDKIQDKWHTNCESFTISGNTTSASAVIIVPSTASLHVNDSVNGSGIPAKSFILSIDSATQITINQTATATASGITLTIGSGDPHSFHRLPGTFNSRDLTNTESFVSQRISNLRTDPTILSTIPTDASLLGTIPSVDIIFSKLMNDAAGDSSHYTLGGAGSAGLTKGTASYTGRNKIENVATLPFTGMPSSDGSLIITLDSSITDTSGTSLNVSYRTINYTIDLPPRITGLKINPR